MIKIATINKIKKICSKYLRYPLFRMTYRGWHRLYFAYKLTQNYIFNAILKTRNALTMEAKRLKAHKLAPLTAPHKSPLFADGIHQTEKMNKCVNITEILYEWLSDRPCPLLKTLCSDDQL